MSRNSVNFGTSSGVVGRNGSESSKDKMYEPKNKKKLVRVLTVVAYVFSVSLAAIMLSLFYIFIYHPENRNTSKATETNAGIANNASLDEEGPTPYALPARNEDTTAQSDDGYDPKQWPEEVTQRKRDKKLISTILNLLNSS